MKNIYQRTMLSVIKMKFHKVLLIFLQIASTWAAPIKIIQAQPQIMMHTLQQPSPMETLQSLKAQKLHHESQASTKLQQAMMSNLQQQMTTNTLRELAKIQAMQYATSNHVEMHPPELMQTWLPQIPIQSMQPAINMPWQQDLREQQQSMMPMIQQMSEDAMQEIALQQQMLALQQMQAFNELNTLHSPYTFPQPEPILILLPDEKTENANYKFYKNTNENDSTNNSHTDQDNEEEGTESVIVDSSDDTGSQKHVGTRKAILLIPNARISIGGVISQIPWLPVEVNVPDTAIWAWNGIYNGISSIISIIGSRLPWRPRTQEMAATAEPNVKEFLKHLQGNDYGPVVPAFQVPLDGVIPVHFNH